MLTHLSNFIVAQQAILRLIAIFVGWTIFFFPLFGYFDTFIAWLYVRPISLASSFLLGVLGIPSLIGLELENGLCTLKLGALTYVITQGCTGLFTSTLFVCALLSYPIAIEKKVIGLLIGMPAFFFFGVLRVVIMGIVAVTQPERVEVFHVYIMSIANLGFAIFIWLYWYNNVAQNENSPSIFS